MTVLAPARRSSLATRVLVRRPALLLGILGTIIGFVGSWIPSYWGDEAASVMSATRSLPSLAAELTTIDAVHGVYYAFLHFWMGAFGASELSTRLPSAIAVGFLVSGTVVLTRMFSGTRVAVVVGIVLILLPRTTSMATEARSYALGAAATVWVTVLLVRLLRNRIGSISGWFAYGAAMAASIYLFLYLGLLLLVHAAVVILAYRSQLRVWARGAAIALVLSAPIVVVGYAQRDQIAFLARRNYATALNVFGSQWFDSLPVAALAWALIVVALVAAFLTFRRMRHLPGLTVLATVWLVLPTSVLLIGNATVSPIYNVRYLTFCTPAAAILIGLGIVALTRALRPRARPVLAATLVLLLAGLCLPTYLAQRAPFAKDGGSDLRQVADYIGATAVPGDAIVFDQETKPSRDPRLALRLYPTQFTAVSDVALITPYDQTRGLWDDTAHIGDLDLGSYSTVWAVELEPTSPLPPDVSYLTSHGFTVESTALINRTTIYRLVRN